VGIYTCEIQRDSYSKIPTSILSKTTYVYFLKQGFYRFCENVAHDALEALKRIYFQCPKGVFSQFLEVFHDK
jgi:hypothetical protein